MQRRTAVAAASAISMALVSAVIAASATFGALGFAGSSGAANPVQAPASAAQAAPQPASTSRTFHEGEREGGEREHATTTQSASTPSTGGHEHDD